MILKYLLCSIIETKPSLLLLHIYSPNVCGTVLVVTDRNDLPRQSHKQKGMIK